MASLSELVDTIAAVEGIDPAAVALMARYIREAGLINTAGRGPSAARMSVADAANLLIGVNAATTAVEVARTVSAYRELEASRPWASADDSYIKYGTLAEAIEQLIHATTIGHLPELFLNQGIPDELQEAFDERNAHVALTFRKSELFASATITPIDANIVPDQLHELISRGWGKVIFSFYPPKGRGGPSRKRKHKSSDRIEETTIGYRTLSAVGKLLYS